jgi:hypothetical protein
MESFVKKLASYRGKNERVYRNTLLFLGCTEQGKQKLKNDAKSYLAAQKILEDYRSQLDSDQESDLKGKLEENGKAIERTLVSAYTLVMKYASSGDQVNHFILQNYANRLDEQISTNLYEKLQEEEWLVEKVGYQLLNEHNLLPSPNESVRVKTLYEAFLQFDDKPMITGQDAVKTSLERYCREGRFAIASESNGAFDQFYFKQVPSGFEVTESSYWIVDPSLVPNEEDTGEEPKGPEGEGGRYPSPSKSDGEPTGEPIPQPEETEIQTLTISGKVDLANYNQLFNSFIMPLKDNKVEIEVTIKASTTSGNPLTPSSPQYKSVKESADQLGLKLEEKHKDGGDSSTD